MSKQKEIRINKFLSEAGFCSRREADKLIDNNRVKINGKAPLIGTKVTPGDIVTVDKKVINVEKKKFVYLAFNKPKGIVCTTDVKREKNNIIDYLNYPKRIFPIGRFILSFLFKSPLITSCMVPSPPKTKIALKFNKLIDSIICFACPECVVVFISYLKKLSSKDGFKYFLNTLIDFLFPLLGLIIIKKFIILYYLKVELIFHN